MKFREWVMEMIFRGPAEPRPDRVKERLTARQEIVAEKLAQMKGTTRDEVLAEAYRRADKILARRQRGDG